MNQNKIYSIKKMSTMLDTSSSWLRKTERMLNLQIPRKSKYRYYTDKELELFKNIKKMKDEKIPWTVIQNIFKSIDVVNNDELTSSIVQGNIVDMDELEMAIFKSFSEALLAYNNEFKKENDKLKNEIKNLKEKMKSEFIDLKNENKEIKNIIETMKNEREEEQKNSFGISKLFGCNKK